MSRRKLMYLAIIGLCIASVIIKAQFIKKKMAVETSSISTEWKKNGVPADVIKLTKADMNIYTTVSGVLSGSVINSEVDPDVQRLLREDQPAVLAEGRIKGTVTYVARGSSQLSGLYKVTIKPVLASDSQVKNGDILVAKILTGVKKAVIFIPFDSVFNDGNTTYCWTVRDGKAHRMEIKTGLVSDGKTEILSGLSAGDTVVVNGRSNLTEGVSVMLHNNPEKKI